jgi:hypothetical protein
MGHTTPTYSIARPSEIYPNCDFWFENMPYLATLNGKPHVRTSDLLVDGNFAELDFD